MGWITHHPTDLNKSHITQIIHHTWPSVIDHKTHLTNHPSHIHPLVSCHMTCLLFARSMTLPSVTHCMTCPPVITTQLLVIIERCMPNMGQPTIQVHPTITLNQTWLQVISNMCARLELVKHGRPSHMDVVAITRSHDSRPRVPISYATICNIWCMKSGQAMLVWVAKGLQQFILSLPFVCIMLF